MYRCLELLLLPAENVKLVWMCRTVSLCVSLWRMHCDTEQMAKMQHTHPFIDSWIGEYIFRNFAVWKLGETGEFFFLTSDTFHLFFDFKFFRCSMGKKNSPIIWWNRWNPARSQQAELELQLSLLARLETLALRSESVGWIWRSEST